MPAQVRTSMLGGLLALLAIGQCVPGSSAISASASASTAAVAAATSAVASSAPSVSSTLPPTTTSSASPLSFEVDIIFPRNETYNASETFPIVFAIQNPSALVSSYGHVKFLWGIMPWGNGNTPSGLSTGIWSGRLPLPDMTKSSPYILANFTNITPENYNGHNFIGIVQALQWFLLADDPPSACSGTILASGTEFFSVNLYPNGWSDLQPALHGVNILAPDVSDAPSCPALGAVGNIVKADTVNGSTGCSVRVATATSSGNPCAVTVDAKMASSISSEISHLASELATTSAPLSSLPSPTESSGAQRQAVILAPAAALLALVL